MKPKCTDILKKVGDVIAKEFIATKCEDRLAAVVLISEATQDGNGKIFAVKSTEVAAGGVASIEYFSMLRAAMENLIKDCDACKCEYCKDILPVATKAAAIMDTLATSKKIGCFEPPPSSVLN